MERDFSNNGQHDGKQNPNNKDDFGIVESSPFNPSDPYSSDYDLPDDGDFKSNFSGSAQT